MYRFTKLNPHILICFHIACKHAFLSAWTSRYCQAPILHQHAKSHNLSQMKKNPKKNQPPSLNSAVISFTVNVTAGEPLSVGFRLMFF